AMFASAGRSSRAALPSFPTRRSSDLSGSTDPKAAIHSDVAQFEGFVNEAGDDVSVQDDAVRIASIDDKAFGNLHGNGHRDAAGKDRKSTRLNSSHVKSSYAVFCWKKK